MLHDFRLIAIFFMKYLLYTTMPYILFSIRLLCDCLIVIVTNLFVICQNQDIQVQMWLWVIVFCGSSLYFPHQLLWQQWFWSATWLFAWPCAMQSCAQHATAFTVSSSFTVSALYPVLLLCPASLHLSP